MSSITQKTHEKTVPVGKRCNLPMVFQPRHGGASLLVRGNGDPRFRLVEAMRCEQGKPVEPLERRSALSRDNARVRLRFLKTGVIDVQRSCHSLSTPECHKRPIPPCIRSTTLPCAASVMPLHWCSRTA